MSKKQLNTRSISNELSGASVYFQKPQLKAIEKKKSISNHHTSHKLAQKPEQKVEQLSKGMSTSISTEDIELLAFELRKVRKVKVNTEVPEVWKDKLDTMAHKLKVGKYDLVMYIIGVHLGEVKIDKLK